MTRPRHPATRTFQALRLYLNDELLELARGSERRRGILLKPKGRGLPSSLPHSLEDRIAKRFFAARSMPAPAPPAICRSRADQLLLPKLRGFLTRRPLSPSKDEIRLNPVPALRALGLANVTDAPPHALDLASLGCRASRFLPRGGSLRDHFSPCCVSSISAWCFALVLRSLSVIYEGKYEARALR